MKVHAAIARALMDNGVDTLFGLIGDANMYYVTEYRQAQNGRFVGAVVEGGAVSMADGYARVSGRVGVVSVSHGPAAANTINALVESVRSNTPLLLITGDTPAVRHNPQHIPLQQLFSATGADYHRVLSPDHVVDDIAMMLARVAMTRRAAVLDIPIGLQGSEADYQPSEFRAQVPQFGSPDPKALDTALGILASAKRPVIVAGRGALLSGAREQLIELADILGAPLATTAAAKDFFYGHPYDVGIMGSKSRDWAVDVLSATDCVAAFGAGLNKHTTFSGKFLEGRAVIQCEIDPRHVGRYSPVDVALYGDAAATALDMVDALKSIDHPPGRFRVDRLGEGVLTRSPAEEFRDRSTETTLDIRTAMVSLEELLPRDKTVVTDAGRFSIAPWRYLHVADARNWVQTSGAWGSIGLGTATAIGAAVASPGRLTVGVTGDGGGMMGLIEFSTAVRHNVPFVLVILNDGAYGAEFKKFEDRGYDPKNCLVAWPEFADVAQALGGRGVVVRTLSDLEAAVGLIETLDRPLLIDIKADPAVDPRVP